MKRSDMAPDQLETERSRVREQARKRRVADREGVNAAMREYNKTYLKRPEVRAKATARSKDWVERNRERHTQYMRTYYRERRDKIAFDSRARKYGISVEAQRAMLEAQGHLCAICRKPERGASQYGYPRLLHVDHDHLTGKVRGFLCGDCNNVLGRATDDPAILRAAADYLESHQN